MTTTQKILVTVTTAVVIAALYGAYRASETEREIHALREQLASSTDQIERLQRERDEATRQLTLVREDDERLNQNTGELLALRGEVGALKKALTDAEKHKSAADEPPQSPNAHAAWKLRELRAIGDFQNVGFDTPEAAAETILWAAQDRATNLMEMVSLPPELLAEAKSRGITDLLTLRLADSLISEARSVAKDALQQVWIDGGELTTFTQMTDNGSITYAGVVSFRVSGRSDMGDPTTERSNNLLFARINGVWKLVIPGISPQILEASSHP